MIAQHKYHIRVCLLFVICYLSSVVCFSQLNFDFQQGKFLIKGKVIDVQTSKPLPLANIRINSSNKGIASDNEGNFSFYVYKKDTLRFTSVGYLAKVLHMSDLDSSDYYTLEIGLIRDFIKLKEVTIYPFRTKEEFADAFIDAKDVNKVNVPGIEPPKYSNITPRAKFTNPVSFLYERIRKRRAANPDFKP